MEEHFEMYRQPIGNKLPKKCEALTVLPMYMKVPKSVLFPL